LSGKRRSGAGITRTDLEEARDKVMMGTVRSLAICPEKCLQQDLNSGHGHQDFS
jgi:ATP-dependent Zn protease